MNALLFLFMASSANAVSLFTYASAGCGGAPTSITNYTLNTCYDISQGGQQGSNKVVVCNATVAQINIYMGSNACAGAPAMQNVEVPNTCVSDGSGGFMKIICDPVPVSSTIPMATTVASTTVQVTTASPGTTTPGTTTPGTTQTQTQNTTNTKSVASSSHMEHVGLMTFVISFVLTIAALN